MTNIWLSSRPLCHHYHKVKTSSTSWQDAVLAKQRPTHVREVFAPKLSGAEQLAACAAGAPLAASALFSSVAGLLGSSGQANYAAANAALDAWAGGQHAQVRMIITNPKPYTPLCVPLRCTLHLTCKQAMWAVANAALDALASRQQPPRCACAVALQVSGSPDRLRSCGRRAPAGHACSPACLDDAQGCSSTACHGVHAAW